MKIIGEQIVGHIVNISDRLIEIVRLQSLRSIIIIRICSAPLFLRMRARIIEPISRSKMKEFRKFITNNI